MRLSALSLLACVLLPGLDRAAEPTLEQQLNAEPVAGLLQAARQLGDARRGALLFHQPQLTCSQCHDVTGGVPSRGPDLTRLPADVTEDYLIEAVLDPSKTIRKGYETLVVTTAAGKTLTGLLVEERPQAILLRDLSSGQVITVAKKDIDDKATSPQSLMPTGLVNQLTNRQEFLDLLRYLIELRRGGLARARELQPPPAAYALVLPEYEKQLDHAGLLRTLNSESFKRGEAIYKRLCVNCHGTVKEAGSLPTSLRFATGQFKNGADPYSMYQTLTRGYGLMTPQTWMVPEQKYDVIHYIREAFLKPHNATQYVATDAGYLARLPAGTTRGPKPILREPWKTMDYGPLMTNTYEVGATGNFAFKGLAIRVDPGTGGVARGQAWMLYDHDTLRLAAAWTGPGYIDWNGIQFNGLHAVHPRLVGKVRLSTPMAPGWANPATGRFDDPRLQGRDQRRYGPLPRDWAHYRGLYRHGDKVILSYTVGDAAILEMPSQETGSGSKEVVFRRTLQIGRSSKDLLLRLGPAEQTYRVLGCEKAELQRQDGLALLRLPAAALPTTLAIRCGTGADLLQRDEKIEPLESLTHGSPRRWAEVLRTTILPGLDQGPFAVDVLTPPDKNPWECQLRLTGLDFFPDGKRAAVCTWDGDVWLVSGFDGKELTWQRIAAGLFQPLGLKIVGGRIHLTCRDQLVRLHDLNGDGEMDFYENVNSDHLVTEHYHEFAMGLQTDAAGNFYYAKSARHALPALVPHHGTLLKVSADGARTDILATGFRAANGVCLNNDGTFFVTDQEGHWTPKNRINLVKPGGFYGNMWGYHDVTDSSDSAMEQPLCWITNSFDRSPAELLWANSPAWGALQGTLLNLSYGMGRIYVVPHETVKGHIQGGMCPLPLTPFPTGVMRGRFHPVDGQLYACGMYAWAGNQQQPGGFYRIRYTGKPVHLPIKMHVTRTGVALTFSGDLDPASVGDLSQYAVKVWGLRRSQRYGSEHVNEHPLRVTAASLGADGRTLQLTIADLAPTRCLEIRYQLRGRTGEAVNGTFNGTLHELPD